MEMESFYLLPSIALSSELSKQENDFSSVRSEMQEAQSEIAGEDNKYLGC